MASFGNWWVTGQQSVQDSFSAEFHQNFIPDFTAPMDETTLSIDTDYFHGNIVYNSATNEIKIYDSDKNEFVKINIDTDSSKKPIGIKLNNIPIDLNHLNTVSKKNLEDTELYYKTGPDDLKNLI
jgi:hypothetical protein